MQLEVSVGEVLDKFTILRIKLRKISDPSKLKNIQTEHSLIQKTLQDEGINLEAPEISELEAVNLKLWEIEDQIRVKEQKKEFGDEFIQLARSVYFENDKRAAIKKTINLQHGSKLIEEKQYVDYTRDAKNSPTA